MERKTKKITYEDCGVSGSRCVLKPGVDFHLSQDKSFTELVAEVVSIAMGCAQQEDAIYPFRRIGVVFVFMDGRISFAFPKDDKWLLIDDVCEAEEDFELGDVGSLLASQDVQLYQIMQQVNDSTFVSLGSRNEGFDEEYGLAHDFFRCLDMRGICKVASEKHYGGSQNHVVYELGEDLYIEALDDETTGGRGFWIGRHFQDYKYQLAEYELGDTNYQGLFDDDGNLIIDRQVAEKICELSSPNEFFFIDNDYMLSMRDIGMEEIEMDLAMIRERGVVISGNDLLQ